jgi:hypothetical protein
MEVRTSHGVYKGSILLAAECHASSHPDCADGVKKISILHTQILHA